MKVPHPGWPGSVRLAPTWHQHGKRKQYLLCRFLAQLGSLAKPACSLFDTFFVLPFCFLISLELFLNASFKISHCSSFLIGQLCNPYIPSARLSEENSKISALVNQRDAAPKFPFLPVVLNPFSSIAIRTAMPTNCRKGSVSREGVEQKNFSISSVFSNSSTIIARAGIGRFVMCVLAYTITSRVLGLLRRSRTCFEGNLGLSKTGRNLLPYGVL